MVSRFNELVTRALLAGALETLKRYRVPEGNVEVSSVRSIPATPSLQLQSGAELLLLMLDAVDPAVCRMGWLQHEG